MKNKLVANGEMRFLQAKRTVASPESIRKKYAAALAAATSPGEKLEIEKRLAQELLRRETTSNHWPSPKTLW